MGFNDELATLKSDHPRLNVFPEIEFNYYIATTVTERQNATLLANSTLNSVNITFLERQDRPKLPEIKIPNFNGDHAKWV